MQFVGSWLVWIAANWVALVVVLLAFGFIIFVHEMGHFLCAKRVGITVHEFALGFGPKLYSRKVNETEYCLRIFPFGGFVRMEGEDDPDADPNDPGSFQNKSVMSQIMVLAGGCFMNYVSALIVLLLIGFCRGIPDMVPVSEVGDVVADTPAAKAGIKAGDRILSVNGVAIENFQGLLNEVRPRAGQPLTLQVEHEGTVSTVNLVADYQVDQDTKKRIEDPKTKQPIGMIGVKPANKITLIWAPASGAGEVFAMAGGWLNRITLLPVEIVRRLTTHQMTVSEVKEGTGGPLLIGQMLFELYHQGIWALLFFWAIICTSVGSFNLLPIPALDGARILFVGLGALRGRPLDPRKESVVHFVGLMVLLAVMFLFTIHDVGRMMKGVHFF